MKIKTIKMIEVQDWDDLVIKTYGKPYSFQQQNGCQSRGVYGLTIPDSSAEDFENDTIPDEVNGYEMGVSFASWLARDPSEWNGDPSDSEKWYIDLFWERNFYPSIEVVANDLFNKGLIEAGEYKINIDW